MSKFKKILVTGASGFIGTNLVRALIKDGRQVRALVRESDRRDELESLGADLIRGDVSNRESLQRAVYGVDAVFHLAAVLGYFGIPKELFFKTNVEGTKNILEVCLAQNVKRFIHCSTTGVLGHHRGKSFDESQPYNPTNIYEQTKCQGEILAKDYFTKGLDITIVRPAFVYGPYDRSNTFRIFKAIQDKRFFIIGKGQNILQPTYIDDLVGGFLLCLDNPRAVGQIYTLCGDMPVKLEYFVSLIADNLNVKIPRIKIPVLGAAIAANVLDFLSGIFKFDPILTKSRLQFFTDNHSYLIDKAKKELNYQPKVSVKEGIEKTIKAYKEKGYLK